MAIPHPLKKQYKPSFDAIDDDINLLRSFLNHVEENEIDKGRDPIYHPQHIFNSERLLWLEEMRKELQKFAEDPEYDLTFDTIVDSYNLEYFDIDFLPPVTLK